MSTLLRKQTVLIVDDSPDNLELLSHVLAHDYRVKVAMSGEKALEIAYADDPPDLILLDVMMPGMSGFEVCQRLKSNPDRRGIPVIFITGLTGSTDETQGLAVGAVDYITKPFNPAIVKARVSTHLALYDQTRELERMVDQRTSDLRLTRQQIIRRLGRAAEFKDNETGNHVIRMAHYSRLIAKAYGLGEAMTELIFQTAPMHDIGKIGIPDAILLKSTPLTEEEAKVMFQHPQMGAEIIGVHENDILHMAQEIAMSHHEKWDGSGYPLGLSGEEIPLAGRIVAIADVFDALLSVRSYKPAYSLEKSLEIMDSENGKHFDPMLMQAFYQALPEILAIRTRFSDDNGALTDLDVEQVSLA